METENNNNQQTEPAKAPAKAPVKKDTKFVTIKDNLPKLEAKNTIWEVSDMVWLKGVGMKNTLGYIRRALQDYKPHHMSVNAGDIQCYSIHNEYLPKAKEFAPAV